MGLQKHLLASFAVSRCSPEAESEGVKSGLMVRRARHSALQIPYPYFVVHLGKGRIAYQLLLALQAKPAAAA